MIGCKLWCCQHQRRIQFSEPARHLDCIAGCCAKPPEHALLKRCCTDLFTQKRGSLESICAATDSLPLTSKAAPALSGGQAGHKGGQCRAYPGPREP